MMKKKLTHTSKNGKANMVDVSDKEISIRTAEAYSEVKISDEVFKAIKENNIKKGDVLTVAKIAGIQAAKKTAELIPLCHNIFITKIDVDLQLNEEKKRVEIKSFAKTKSETGIEMEALTAASVAALTVYDMCKAIDKSMVISETKLILKTGGKSGVYKLDDSNNKRAIP
jgi:molybdenum cofactor biosynthesis protein MoaC